MKKFKQFWKDRGEGAPPPLIRKTLQGRLETPRPIGVKLRTRIQNRRDNVGAGLRTSIGRW